MSPQCEIEEDEVRCTDHGIVRMYVGDTQKLVCAKHAQEYSE